MAWDEEIVSITRALIDDTSDTPTYSDDRLEQAIIVAARLVLQELDFVQPFKASITDNSILPDPTDEENNTRDESFINLVSVRAACIVDRGSAMRAAGQAIRIRDGTSEVDLRDVFKSKLALIQKGWCSVYDDMKFQYQSSQQSVVVGAAIIGPFRLFACGGDDRAFLTGDPRG